MKTYKTVQKTVNVIDQHTCDVCNKDIKRKDAFDASITTVEAKIGEVYPEGSFRKIYSIDICPDCFEDKLIPLVTTVLAVEWNEREED